MKCVRVCPVPCHQKPAGEARLHHVIAGAGCGLCDLAKRHIEVAFQHPLQPRALCEFAVKRGDFHAQRSAIALHHCPQRRQIHTEYERDPQHAFVTDQTHFQSGMAVNRGYQGDKAFRGKVNVTNGVAGFRQDLCDCQFHRLATGQNSLTAFTRQGRKQTIGSRGGHGRYHIFTPRAGNPSSGIRESAAAHNPDRLRQYPTGRYMPDPGIILDIPGAGALLRE